MNDTTLVLCYPVADSDLNRIESEFCDYRIVVSSQESIHRDIFAADLFCGHAKSKPIDWASVVKSGRLKWIQSSAAGLDHCLTAPVIKSNIVVSGCSGLFANQVAEQTMALLFGLIRRIPTFIGAKEKREFIRQPTDDLHGKAVGIVGFGGNGRRIAELLNGIVDKILVTDLFPEYEIPDFVDKALPPSHMKYLFENCDIVVVTLPLNSDTHKLIGAEMFSAMRPQSYFINVARGRVVDHEALVNALHKNQIAFAGLDVVDPEPLPTNSPLWDMKNVIITPHVGAQSTKRVSSTTELLCCNRQRFENGETLINQVDKNICIPHPSNRLKITPDGKIQLPIGLALKE